MPDAPSITDQLKAQVEASRRADFAALKPGDVVTVDGVACRVGHVNAGRRRLSVTPVNADQPMPVEVDRTATGRRMGPGRAEHARQKRLRAAIMAKRRVRAEAKRKAKAGGDDG